MFQLLLRLATIALIICIAGCSAWNEFWMNQGLKRMRADALSKIDIEACEANGGTIKGVCMFGTPACVIPFSDADKRCSDSSECEGLCWTDVSGLEKGVDAVGRCTANSQGCKCGAEIIAGKVDVEICED